MKLPYLLTVVFLFAFSFLVSGCAVNVDPATGKYTLELDWGSMMKSSRKKNRRL